MNSGKATLAGNRAQSLNPSFTFFQENQASIAVTPLVPPRWKKLSDDWVGTCFDERILITFGSSRRSIQFWPVDLRDQDVNDK